MSRLCLQTCLWVRSYCERLKQESFWGGEVEILVLSRMLKVPIYVFKTAEEAGRCARARALF